MYVINAQRIETFDISDSWGFFVDIEGNQQIIEDNSEMMRKKYNIKKLFNNNKFKNTNFRDYKGVHIETINEEYEYYTKNNNYDDEYQNESFCPNNIKKESFGDMIVTVSSTTLLTAAITYFVFFLI